MTQSISRQTPTAGPAPGGGACRRSREVPAMVEAQVVGLMKMPVGFVNMCTMPTGISNNKGLKIDNIAVTLRLAPTPIPSIDTAQ